MPDSKTLHRAFVGKTGSCRPFGFGTGSPHAGAGFLKAFRTFIAAFALFVGGFLSTMEAGPSIKVRTPRLRSAAVIVQDQNTDEFLLSKKAQDVMPIASITKLMTAMS